MSNITFQLVTLLVGVVVIVVGLTLSDLVTAAVAGANTYEVRYNTVRNSDEVLGECVFQSQPETALDTERGRLHPKRKRQTSRYGHFVCAYGNVWDRGGFQFRRLCIFRP